jgi:predicted transposase YdaD
VERDKIALDALPDEQAFGKQTRESKGPKMPPDPQPKKDAHPYDNLTKALFGLDGAQIIPQLLAGAEVLAAQNVEVDRSKLKVDLVFQILYQGVLVILNIELQSGPDANMGSRVLQYLAGLHDFYQLPVICLVIYLFPCTVAQSPYVIECGDKTSLVLNYEVIRWWEVDGATIVDKHAIHLYPLLPATKEPRVDLLRKALQEMFQVYDRHKLGYRFSWFYSILRRTSTMSEEAKQIIEKELKVQFNYQELIEDDPIIQELFAERELKGKAEGKVEGLQQSIMNFLQARFPALAATPQARQAVVSIQDIERLDLLQQALYIASDEQTARRFLKLPAQEDLV